MSYKPSDFSNLMNEKLQPFLLEQKYADIFSGVVLIAQHSEPIFTFTSGFANKEEQKEISLRTPFNLGSLNKMFTGVAIAQLIQEKLVQPQDNIKKFLPNFPRDKAEITVEDILLHKEGFSSYFNDAFIKNRLKLETTQDYLQLFKDEPLLFTPGTKYQYSNSGYVVLGAIIEAVTKLSYEEYIKKNLYEVVGMKESGLFTYNDSSIAHGYTYRKPFSQETSEGERRDTIDELPYKGSPAGGGYASSEDLIKFSQALFSHQLLSDEMTKVLLTPRENLGTKNGQTLFYGYGFQILDVGDGHLRYGHAGAFAGVSARLDIYPWLGLTVVVLSNYDDPIAKVIANKIMEIILSK